MSTRILWLLASLLAASLLVFAVLDILPGDPARSMLGLDATPEDIARLHRALGLDRPLPLQYLDWIGGLLRLQLGTSMTYGVPVAQLLAGRIAVTLPLACFALLLTAAIALPLGMFGATRARRLSGTLLAATAQLGQAVPDFWLGLALILAFALRLHWAPSGGFPGWQTPLAALHALVLPALALALPQAAILSRVLRAALVDVLQAEFIRTARAQGLTGAHILWRRALPNALVPVLTVGAMQFSFLIAGTIVIETVFDLPGLGRMLFDAIGQHDLVVIRDLVLLIAAAILVVGSLAEALYGWLDPRLRQPR